MRCARVGTLLLLMELGSGCDKRGSECKTLIGAMRTLGRKLAAAQTVTSSESANAQQIASALGTFAKEAAIVGSTLGGSKFTIPELERIAQDASDATTILVAAASNMANVAKRMKGAESARNAARIQRTLGNVAASNLQRACGDSRASCAPLHQLLRSRPPFPETTIDSAAAAAWTSRMSPWLDELSTVPLTDQEVTLQVANLREASNAFMVALKTLGPANDLAQELTQATKAFDAQIVRINGAVVETEAFCR